MKRFRSIAIALAALAGTALILLVAANFLIPQLLENSALGDKVGREISILVEGDFTFERLDIAIFPSPHAVLVKPQLRIEDQFSASLQSVELYPDIISSLTGHITVQRIVVTQPDVTVWISGSAAGRATAHQNFDSSTITRSLLNMLFRLPLIDHGTISQGRITLIHNHSAAVTFEKFNGTLHNVADSITIESTATSALTEKISFNAKLNRQSFAGNAHVNVERLNLCTTSTLIPANSAIKVEDGTAGIDLSLTFDGDGRNILDFSCTAPRIRLAKLGQTVDLQALKLAGTAELKTPAIHIAISDFQLGYPAMHAHGSAGLIHGDPRIRFELEGRDIDVSSTREVLLAMAGTTPVVKTVFSILRDGSVPALTISSQADAPRDLAGLDNLVLDGSLAGGTVFIPGADVELTDVSGTIDITTGILAGHDVAAQWQHSRMHQGKFYIDLTKTSLPLEVDIQTDVQAADVVIILNKFITGHTFSEELARIDDIKGIVTGNLSLSGDLERLNVAVATDKLNFSGRHPGLPFPLHIYGGSLSYDNDQLHVNDLAGALGTSSFAALSGSIDLREANNFAIASGRSRIVIEEILPWLASYEPISGITNYYGGGESILHLNEIKIRGSFDNLSLIHFDLAGDLRDLSVRNLPAQPDPLSIVSMKVTADPSLLSFSEVKAHLLDGSVQGAGTYNGYLKTGPKEISLSFEGRAGPRVIGWTQEAGGLPPWVKLRPLAFGKSRLTYSNHGGGKITATLALQDELELLTELSFAPQTIVVDSLTVEDQLSKASFNGRKAGTHFDVSFAGTLDDSTIKKILHLPGLQSGSLAGKATLSGNLELPENLTFLGELSGTQISLHSVPEPPLMIKDIKVKGIPEGIAISSAELSWNGAAAHVAGSVWPRTGALPKFDLDVEAETIDADSMSRHLGGEDREQKSGTAAAPAFSHLEGQVRLKADTFILHGYSLESIAADLDFAGPTADLTLKNAVLCGLPVKGTATMDGWQISYQVQPTVQSQKLGTTLECLFDKQLKADGTLDFKGSFKGHGAVRELVKSTTGQAEIRLADGRVYRDIIMLNLLKFLNAVQVLTGQVSAENMMEKGVGFDRFEALVKLQNGILRYDRFILDGEEFKLGGSGEMDILEKQLDFTILVAPLKTSSTILEHVPLIGGILETLDTIPLEVKGTFDHIHFLPLAPSAVKDELLDLMSETIDIPLNLVHIRNINNKMKPQ